MSVMMSNMGNDVVTPSKYSSHICIRIESHAVALDCLIVCVGVDGRAR